MSSLGEMIADALELLAEILPGKILLLVLGIALFGAIIYWLC